MKKLIPFFIFALLFAACSSAPPVKPESKNVEVSRDPADEDCKDLGPVEGRDASTKGTFENALEDLKKDAAMKGANYVQIKQTGAMGTSVRGTAYLCL
ncbi:MAG: DUF4156 domain-containing protein [Bdellovibrionales bacterium]|nr:DUF4156 domain-containing protein [Bdellovibrionales bacterium]